MKYIILAITLTACGHSAGGVGPDGGAVSLDTPTTQAEACEIVATTICPVAIACTEDDNLEDLATCEQHAYDYCIYWHNAAGVADNDPPHSNWTECSEILETFTCRTNNYYRPCFNPNHPEQG